EPPRRATPGQALQRARRAGHDVADAVHVEDEVIVAEGVDESGKFADHPMSFPTREAGSGIHNVVCSAGFPVGLRPPGMTGPQLIPPPAARPASRRGIWREGPLLPPSPARGDAPSRGR